MSEMIAGKTKQSGIIAYGVLYQNRRIGCLIIDNGAFNRIDDAVFVDLALLRQWIESDDLIGLVVTGNGRHFSAGANIENIANYRGNAPALEAMLNRGAEILAYIEGLPLVTVAAIRGVCYGAGFEIALACRYRICTENAVFALPETKLGLIPGMGGIHRFSKLVGKRTALKYILSGEQIPSGEALDLGIVEQICDKRRVVETAVEWIEQLAGQLTRAQLSGVFQTIDAAEKIGEDASYRLQSRLFAQLYNEMSVL